MSALGEDHRMVRQEPVVEESQAVKVAHRGGAVTGLAVRHLPGGFGQMHNEPGVILGRQLAALLQ